MNSIHSPLASFYFKLSTDCVVQPTDLEFYTLKWLAFFFILHVGYAYCTASLNF